MCKSRTSMVVAAVVLFVLVGIYAWNLRTTSDRLKPPPEVTDLRTFLLHMPYPEQAYELNVGGSRFIELAGPLPPMSTHPSGPPAYVFDEAHQLVDWTADQGDDPDFVRRWHASERRELTSQEMEELLGRR